MTGPAKGLAVVTGASSGIGYELAACCAADGYDLLVVADEPAIEAAAGRLRGHGTAVRALEADLSGPDGVAALVDVLDRPVDLLLANAGRGLGHAFLDQEVADIRRVIDTNVTGTVLLVHAIGRKMKARGSGRILLTGSIAGFIPGSYQAVYNATKAFVDSFSSALRDELQETGVSVTCLMPGPTDTRFFERADMLETPVGQDDGKDDPAMVAREGYKAMMSGDTGVVTGLSNKLQATMAHVTPTSMLARQHRKMAKPQDE